MYSGGVVHGTPSSQLLTHAARLVRVVTRAAASDSPAILRLLSQLDELGPLTVTDLARADRTSQPTTSAAVKAMEEKGLVTRVAHQADARSTLVTLAEPGREELRAARLRHAAVLDELVARHGVSRADLETAVTVLRTLTAPTTEN
jgi:DNA-binding MarR family transcriptional regulator